MDNKLSGSGFIRISVSNEHTYFRGCPLPVTSLQILKATRKPSYR